MLVLTVVAIVAVLVLAATDSGPENTSVTVCKECGGRKSVMMCFTDVTGWEPTPCPACQITTTFHQEA